MARNYGGIAQGLEAGIRLGQGIQDRKDRKEQADREYGLRIQEQGTRLARQAERDAREDADYAVRVADDEHRSGVADAATALSQYKSFDNMPPEVQARISEQARSSDASRTAAREKRRGLVFGKPAEQQSLIDIVTNLKTGRTQVEDVPSDQLWLAMTNALQRDPSDFMGTADKPSIISQAVGDVTAGLETGNEGMLLSGANVLLAPELRKGVGSTSPHGGKIVFKEIERFVPHPDNPSLVTPVVRVYVDQGDGFKGPRGKHKETSYYLAPLTEGRSSDPNDPVKFIDMQQTMDRVGQMGALTEAFNQPEFRRRLEEGRTSAGGRTKDLVDTLLGEAQQALPKKQITTENVKLGDSTLRITKDAQGNETGRETLAHTVKAPRERTFELKNEQIDQMVEDGEISEAEGRRMKAKNVSGIDLAKNPNGSGRGGSGGGAGKPGKVTEAETKGLISSLQRHIASGLKIQQHPTSKRWITADGKPAPQEVLDAYNEAVRLAETQVRDNAAGGKKTTMSDALKTAGGAAPAPAAAAKDPYVVGEIRQNSKGVKARYLGAGKWEKVD